MGQPTDAPPGRDGGERVSTVFAGAIPPNEGNFGGVTGFDFTVNTTGDVDGIWWYQPTGSAAAVTPGLYDTQTQALLATAPGL